MIDIKDMKFGALVSKPDDRDYSISAAIPITTQFPKEYLIPDFHTAIYNQYTSSECVGFSIRWLCEWMNKRELKRVVELSEKFIYGNRYPNQDSFGLLNFEGMYGRDALKNLVSDGICENALLKPIGNEWYNYFSAITPAIRENAKKYRAKSYVRIYSDNELKNTLTKVGAVLASIPITNLYGKAIHSLVSKEYADKNKFTNHMVVVCGWKVINNKEYWIIVNSYGKEFGENGVFYYEVGSHFNELWTVVDDVTPSPSAPKYYRVQLVACREKDSTKPFVDKLIKLGYKYYLPYINGWYKIQVYALSNKTRAEEERDKLRKLGFKDAYVTYY